MRRHLQLTPRLQLLADWVPQGARMADIGTDHAFLPVWLLLHGRVAHALASDLRKGPLTSAQRTADEYGVTEGLTLRLGDGLAGIAVQEADTIVVAGMGGENIAAILAAAPWTRDGAHTLLLQPMSRGEVLRDFLAEHGYAIRREQLVEDRGTIYPVMLVTAGEMTLSLGQRYAGAALLRDPLENQFLIQQIVRLFQALGGLSRSHLPEDRQKADEMRELITALMTMREEWRHANCGRD